MRGKLEHWSVRNASIACETPHIDQLLRFKDGLPSPKGSLRQAQQDYLDFWDIMGYIRPQMATGDYSSQSYTGSFARVRSLEELLSRPESHGRLV